MAVRGRLQFLPREVVVQMGREGGIVCGMLRKEKIMDRYRLICSNSGLDAALIACRKDSWKSGYYAAQKRRFAGKMK